MSATRDELQMKRAIALASSGRRSTSPNPWVGAVVVDAGGLVAGEGVTAPAGGQHAEVMAISAAGEKAAGGTLFVTLEPCVHHGRTPPCADLVLSSGIRRVVVGIEDPDHNVAGAGIARLRDAGLVVDVGIGADEVAEQLRPYLTHRRSGRPFVVLKLATTLDGRIAAPDGSSRWITGPEARHDVHRLRAESDAVLVGAGTVRADDPELTVRLEDGGAPVRQPLRVVLGRITKTARVQPALEMSGDLDEVLEDLGRRGVIQLLVEGGAHVAGEFHRRGLVDRYVLYMAPALLGGDDGRPVMAGPGAPAMDKAWRGRITAVQALGDDLKIVLDPRSVERADTEGQVG